MSDISSKPDLKETTKVPSSNGEAGAAKTDSATTASSKPKFNQELLISTVKSLQFAWFVGHVITLTGIFFFSLTKIRIGVKFFKFWNALALVGIIESFGILIFQLVQKRSSNVFNIIKDDNTHYFLLSSSLLLLRPYLLLPLLPFALFSVFHVLAYTKTFLLPVFGLENHTISKRIDDFVSHNNVKSVQLASVLEIYTYIFLALRLITFRKRSLTPFLIYSIFLKARYEKSVFTRNYVKSLEVKLDGYVNSTDIPALKQGWTSFKHGVRKVGSFYIVNDYTKEKST